MIPGEFEYHRPSTLADAVKLLSELGDEARPLAGGHSLIPMMKLRFATPEHLIDLGAIDQLKGICRDGDALVIGAMTTQADIINSAEIASLLPIIRETRANFGWEDWLGPEGRPEVLPGDGPLFSDAQLCVDAEVLVFNLRLFSPRPA